MTAVPTAVRRDLRGKACCSGTPILLGGRTAPGTHGAGGELQAHCPGGTGQGRPPSTGRAALCGRPPPPSGRGAQRGSAARLLLLGSCSRRFCPAGAPLQPPAAPCSPPAAGGGAEPPGHGRAQHSTARCARVSACTEHRPLSPPLLSCRPGEQGAKGNGVGWSRVEVTPERRR